MPSCKRITKHPATRWHRTQSKSLLMSHGDSVGILGDLDTVLMERVVPIPTGDFKLFKGRRNQAHAQILKSLEERDHIVHDNKHKYNPGKSFPSYSGGGYHIFVNTGMSLWASWGWLPEKRASVVSSTIGWFNRLRKLGEKTFALDSKTISQKGKSYQDKNWNIPSCGFDTDKRLYKR